jgi:hypothetical protein
LGVAVKTIVARMNAAFPDEYVSLASILLVSILCRCQCRAHEQQSYRYDEFLHGHLHEIILAGMSKARTPILGHLLDRHPFGDFKRKGAGYRDKNPEQAEGRKNPRTLAHVGLCSHDAVWAQHGCLTYTSMG